MKGHKPQNTPTLKGENNGLTLFVTARELNSPGYEGVTFPTLLVQIKLKWLSVGWKLKQGSEIKKLQTEHDTKVLRNATKDGKNI